MKRFHHSLLGLSALLILFLLSCSDTAGSGSGTGTGNPVIIGTVTDSLGTPIVNAKVIVRPTDYLANNRNIDYLGEGVDDKGFAYTNKNGKYELEIKDIDEYYVEVLSKDTQTGIVKTINVTSVDSGDTFTVADAIVEVLDTFGGRVNLHGGPNDLTTLIEVFVLGREEVDTILSGEDYTLLLPRGKHNFLIRPMDTATYNSETYNGYTSEVFNGYVNILAKNPISETSECDSLILFQYLLVNGMFNELINAGDTLFPEVIDSIFKLYADYEQGKRVTYLNIANQRAYNLLDHPLGLSELQFLRFSNCGLSIISDKIGHLQNLDTLSLRMNHLTSLPDSITNLKDLEYLNLEGNNIASLPDSVKKWADEKDPDWATTQDE